MKRLKKIGIGAALTMMALQSNAAVNTSFELMPYGFNKCDVEWGSLQKNISKEEIEALAIDAHAVGYTYHPSLKYGQVMKGFFPSGCQSPSNESWPLYLLQTQAYEQQDFGYNRCEVEWGKLYRSTTEEEMIARAEAADAEGFTYHPGLAYGKLMVGSYPEGCESPTNESWPLFLNKKRVYKQMSYGFNGCDVSWGSLKRRVNGHDMVMAAAEAGSKGFTFHSGLSYGKVLEGDYPTECQSPANQSWPLFLAD